MIRELDTLSAFRRQMAWYRGKLLKKLSGGC